MDLLTGGARREQCTPVNEGNTLVCCVWQALSILGAPGGWQPRQEGGPGPLGGVGMLWICCLPLAEDQGWNFHYTAFACQEEAL